MIFNGCVHFISKNNNNNYIVYKYTLTINYMLKFVLTIYGLTMILLYSCYMVLWFHCTYGAMMLWSFGNGTMVAYCGSVV